MKHLKRFNETDTFEDGLPSITFDEAKEWILQNYTNEKVVEMFDAEINSGNWIDRDQMEEEGYESEYDYYIDYGRGEAEDAVMDQIINDLKIQFEPSFSIVGDETNLYDFMKSEYDCL